MLPFARLKALQRLNSIKLNVIVRPDNEWKAAMWELVKNLLNLLDKHRKWLPGEDGG